MRGREREDWLIQFANCEGAWPKRPYECFWLKVSLETRPLPPQRLGLVLSRGGRVWETAYTVLDPRAQILGPIRLQNASDVTHLKS